MSAPFLPNHLPPNKLAQRSLNHQLVKNLRSSAGGQDLKVEVKAYKIYANSDLMRPKVTKPSAEEILHPNHDDLSGANKLCTSMSYQVVECGSTFVAEVFHL